MANEISIDYGITSKTLYAIITNTSDQFYNANTPGFETESDANWTSTKYCKALSELNASGHYHATFPVVAAGLYGISIRLQAGGSPATTDTVIGSGIIQWNGTTEISLNGVALSSTGLDSVLMSDIAAVPGITSSIVQAINWLFCLGRNKRTQTSTTELVKKDNGTTTLATSTKSDDGTTFTRGAYS